MFSGYVSFRECFVSKERLKLRQGYSSWKQAMVTCKWDMHRLDFQFASLQTPRKCPFYPSIMNENTPYMKQGMIKLKIDPLSQKKTTISKKISSLGLFHVFLQPHVSFLHLRNVWNVCVFILKPPPPPQNALRMAAMYDNITDNNAEFLASQKNGFVLVFSWLVRERKIWYVSNYIYIDKVVGNLMKFDLFHLSMLLTI